jgi:5'-AMP-activated protein kinase regulatory beta subunit
MMTRSSSDASMSPEADTVKVGNLSVENWLDDDTVPTVFRWEHGGRQVYITGTFNGWSRQIPMHRSGNDFTYIHNLKRGKHAFKFIVDDEWRFAPDQPTVADIEGRINNFIDVTDFKPYTGDREFEKEKAAAEYGFIADEDDTSATEAKDGDGTGPDRDGEVFSQTMPDMDEYTKVSSDRHDSRFVVWLDRFMSLCPFSGVFAILNPFMFLVFVFDQHP